MPFLAISAAAAEPAPVTTLGAPLTSVGTTLTEFEQDLLLMLEGRTDISSAQYKRLINWSYTDLCTSLDIDELKGSLQLTLVPGQPLYALPYAVDFIEEASLVLPKAESISEGYPLDKHDLNAYRSAGPSDGDPTFFFRQGDILVLYPTPDKARTLNLDVKVRPQWLVNGTDSPIIPVEWHEAILLGARKRGFSTLLEFDKALPVENEFVGLVRRRTDREAQDDSGRVIGSSVPRRVEDLRNRVVMRKGDY